ncbi:hypothetical protein B0J11DRAFT_37695 [Dendryphion nanum]|uniref:Uncharacterized protein n=1 Tax=Dendryphion nanum TaxID=256645 RepID=A0A9P9ELM5_9PLEO|nr:hypothetical protein B0J11DRAFT_37695 [Dendryphion nanum]
MAEESKLPELDLAQILKTLASLPQAQAPNNAPPAHDPKANDHHQYLAPQDQYYDFSGSSSSAPPATRDPRLSGRIAPVQRHQSPQQPPRSSTPTVDPATITEWKHGLRCVSKVAAQNPSFSASIQKLIKDQERNMRDWDNGRKRLVEEQTAKRENEKTQRAAISLPGILDNAPVLRTPECEKEELDSFYQKVHRACARMTESQTVELKRLGVPFFGTRPHLMLSDDDEGDDDSADGQGKITKKQLIELQRKMLNHLMELYGD